MYGNYIKIEEDVYQFLYKLVKGKMYSLYFDGASKHNPGQAACGAVLYDENNMEVDYDSKYLEIM